MSTITRDVTVGIYDTKYKATIHADKILVSSPYLEWDNNLAFEEYRLTCSDLISAVKAYLDRGDKDSAWEEIGHYVQDDYLALITKPYNPHRLSYIRDYTRLYATIKDGTTVPHMREDEPVLFELEYNN